MISEILYVAVITLWAAGGCGKNRDQRELNK